MSESNSSEIGGRARDQNQSTDRQGLETERQKDARKPSPIHVRRLSKLAEREENKARSDARQPGGYMEEIRLPPTMMHT